MSKCKISGKKLLEIYDFGKQPLGNGFLTQRRFPKEYFFKMIVAFCNQSKMFQLKFQPNPKKMFHKNYAFYSSTSEYMKIHFRNFFNTLLKHKSLKTNDIFVVEIGSNDGIMLKYFLNKKIKHLGIEPSSNVAKIAKKNGINTKVSFFDNNCTKYILNKFGKANVVYAANVMCHIPNIRNVFANIKKLIKKDGIFVFEDPYLGDVIKKNSYDQIYDEHVFLFSVHSIKYLASLYKLELFDAEHQITHGGSMRYFISHEGSYKPSKTINKYLISEKKIGLDNFLNLKRFSKKIEKSKNDLLNLLIKLKKQGKSVAGYAATSKSTTILNLCGINSDLIDYIADTTLDKQNKFSPGMHIPIKSNEYFKKNYPDYAVLFAWNHKDEIFKKEKEFIKNGGKWIIFIPKVKIL